MIGVYSQRKWVDVFIGMGSNLGDRFAILQTAVDRLSMTDNVEVCAVSPVYETEAHVLPDSEPQPDHLNAVLQIRTTLLPEEVLALLKKVEMQAGREVGAQQWQPRTLDLDILLFGNTVLELRLPSGQTLTLPHPRLAERNFVLRPLTDLVHNLSVPGADGVTVSDLLERSPDKLGIRPYSEKLTL